MQFIEGIGIELKREYTDEVKKTAVAFANGAGGKIYLGVTDDGAVVGLGNPDMLARQVAGG